MTGPYVTSRKAAEQLGIGTSTLNKWAREGYVEPALRTRGGQARWDLDDLRRQLAERRTQETGERPT